MCSTLARPVQVLEFDSGSEPDFTDKLTSFEVVIEEYETAADVTLSDNVRAAIVIQNAQESHETNISYSPERASQVANERNSSHRFAFLSASPRWESPDRWTFVQSGQTRMIETKEAFACDSGRVDGHGCSGEERIGDRHFFNDGC